MNDRNQSLPARTLTVAESEGDRRLDNFLLQVLRGVPRTRIYRMIRNGEVRVNKGRARPAYRVVAGDQVRIPPVHDVAARTAAPISAGRAGWILDRILYEDDDLLVLDKPAGLAVHGGSGIRLGAIELLRSARPDEPMLELVHRLDRETSGCLLVARRRSSLRNLHEQFRLGEIDKQYIALLTGKWRGKSRKVNLPLEIEHRRNGERHVRTATDGKEALTWFHPVERFRDGILCRVDLHTGRTHQIRVHAAAIGHPVAGDSRYGTVPDWPEGLHRLFLHAAMLRFSHPRSGQPLELNSPLSPELEAVLLSLRQQEGSKPSRDQQAGAAQAARQPDQG